MSRWIMNSRWWDKHARYTPIWYTVRIFFYTIVKPSTFSYSRHRSTSRPRQGPFSSTCEAPLHKPRTPSMRTSAGCRTIQKYQQTSLFYLTEHTVALSDSDFGGGSSWIMALAVKHNDFVQKGSQTALLSMASMAARPKPPPCKAVVI